MKVFNIKNLMAVLALGAVATSCNDYLDELPDNRMELKNKEEVSKLLISAYPTQVSTYLLETYSDNTDDNVGPSWSEYDMLQREMWNWADITDVGSESPQELWDAYYSAIASANLAIEYMDGLSSQAGYEAQLGEALCCRAYNMFKLSEVFCMAYDPATAATELGLPYPLKPEKTIGETYVRGTLEELYEKIDADLQRALPLTSNEYSAPKYHFTQNAAYAFACRFYLNYRKYDKAIEYATKVLGSNPSSKLRDWAEFCKVSPNGQYQPNDYVDSKKTANLLLIPAFSQLGVYVGPYLTGCKYRHSKLIADKETLDTTGPWGTSNGTLGFYKWNNNSFPGPFVRTIPYAFEYTDVQAGIGNAHTVMAEFTTDKLLMERAEANALAGNYQAAVDDINEELKAYKRAGVTIKTLTLDEIKDFYKGINYYLPERATVKKKFNSSIVTDMETQEPLLQCILHLQRIMTLHEGHRMQTIKRYGIEIYRRSVSQASEILEIKDSLKVDDPRRAIQLPQDVITSGMQPNPRN